MSFKAMPFKMKVKFLLIATLISLMMVAVVMFIGVGSWQLNKELEAKGRTQGDDKAEAMLASFDVYCNQHPDASRCRH